MIEAQVERERGHVRAFQAVLLLLSLSMLL